MVLYHIFDAFLGKRDKDWNKAIHEVYLEGEVEAKERRAKEEEARIQGTSPSLPSEDYVGLYTDELYGEAEIRIENGVLTLKVGPAFVGVLEHWHFDTFRARWEDAQLGRAWVESRLNRQGKVEEMEVQGWRAFQKTEGQG